jgi:hypothetical protein
MTNVTEIQFVFNKGDKVIPINKSSGRRGLTECATFYAMEELEQEFLFVTGVDQEATKLHKEPCYWCNPYSPNGGGDSFKETDLVLQNEH